MPSQIGTEQEANNVEAANEATKSSTAGVLTSSFFLNVLISGSMDQIWSILNSLQIVELVGLFNIKQPGNMSAFSTFFGHITSVKLIDTAALLSENVYVPEQDPHTLNFQNAGFTSVLMIVNASNFLLYFAL